MRKLVLSFVALMVIIFQGYAQDGGKGHIGISLGPSIPMGDFGSKDLDKDEIGLANTGAMLDLSFAYTFKESNFGITGLLRGQVNPLDTKVVEDELIKQEPSVIWNVKSENWKISSFMFGVFGSFPISEKTSFDARAMVGFANTNSPENTVTGTALGTTIWVTQKSASAISFAYLFGAGFKFDIGSKLYLLTNIDYFGAEPEFSDVMTTTSDGYVLGIKKCKHLILV